MDERLLDVLRYCYRNCSDKQLVSELLLLTNDVCLCLADETLDGLNFYERYDAIFSELCKRGLAKEDGEPN